MRILYLLLLGCITLIGYGQDPSFRKVESIRYYEKSESRSDDYINERCVLDLYIPEVKENYAVLVWFHGGGLTSGEKYLPEGLIEKGIGVVAVNYRLSPNVKAAECIEDAAESVAWVFNNIEKYGGNARKIFLSGHSAGGYLCLMVGLDSTYLLSRNINPNDLAGIIPFSGHTITHFTIRKEMGIPGTQPVIDRFAPLYHVKSETPPILLITGDRELELLGRYEENAYMYRMMKVNGNSNCRLYELDGYGHNMVYPALPLLVKEIERICNNPGN